MQRRLYFVFADVPEARRLVSELEGAGVGLAEMHCLAPRNAETAGLPGGSDPRRAERLCELEESLWFLNLLLLFTALAGLAAALYVGDGGWATVAAALLVTSGAAAAVFAAGLPFARFSLPVEAGEVVLVVDVPRERAREITRLAADRHPGGMAGAGWSLGGVGIWSS
jgi:hypothetical protein